VDYKTDTLVTVTRFQAATLPNTWINAPGFECIIDDSYYDYQDSDSKGATHWWVNFANKNLFQNYRADKSLHQDEIQCVIAPVLDTIREYLLKSDAFPALTEEPNSYIPTPVLVMGAEIHFSIKSNFYGHVLPTATHEDIDKNVATLKPPYYAANILAMSAPKRKWLSSGSLYTMDIIKAIFATAYTSFRAVVLQSKEKALIRQGKLDKNKLMRVKPNIDAMKGENLNPNIRQKYPIEEVPRHRNLGPNLEHGHPIGMAGHGHPIGVARHKNLEKELGFPGANMPITLSPNIKQEHLIKPTARHKTPEKQDLEFPMANVPRNSSPGIRQGHYVREVAKPKNLGEKELKLSGANVPGKFDPRLHNKFEANEAKPEKKSEKVPLAYPFALSQEKSNDGDWEQIARVGVLRRETPDEMPDTKVVIHTGNWGVGAFHGNFEFMALVQLAAGILAGVTTLHAHGAGEEGKVAWNAAEKKLMTLWPKGTVIALSEFFFRSGKIRV